MLFKEFGNRKNPVIVFLHGGGLSWWSWQAQIDALADRFYVVAPVIDGHGEDSKTVFVSIRDSAEKLINYIKINCDGKVYALCGLSIGAQIAVEVLSRESDIARFAVIESALVYPMKTAVRLTVPMYNLCFGLVGKRWFSKLQAKSLMVPDNFFENYYKDTSGMMKESLINIIISNGNYSVPAALNQTSAKVLIIAGEKELAIMKRSAVLLNDTIPGSELKIIKKYGHGEISLKHPDKYLEVLHDFFPALV